MIRIYGYMRAHVAKMSLQWFKCLKKIDESKSWSRSWEFKENPDVVNNKAHFAVPKLFLQILHKLNKKWKNIKMKNGQLFAMGWELVFWFEAHPLKNWLR